jgi:hypothetical protein
VRALELQTGSFRLDDLRHRRRCRRKIPRKGGPGRPFMMSHLKTGAGLAQIIDDIETKGLLKA